jgi:hypothetical protein
VPILYAQSLHKFIKVVQTSNTGSIKYLQYSAFKCQKGFLLEPMSVHASVHSVFMKVEFNLTELKIYTVYINTAKRPVMLLLCETENMP